MERGVKRRYDSSWRKEQAAQTKRETVRAAHDLFVTRGFPTRSDIAAGPGVSVEAVYAAFGSELNLLKRVCYALMLIRAGDEVTGSKLLASDARGYERLEMGWWQTKTQAELATLRIDKSSA